MYRYTPSECDFCYEQFYSERDFIEHKEDDHWYCRSCDRCFYNQNGLNCYLNTAAVHKYARQVVRRTPTPEPDFDCPSYSAAFYTYRDLEIHRQDKHRSVRNHSCPFCYKQHVSLSATVAHLEAGKCSSGVNRKLVDEFIFLATRGSNASAGALVKRANNAPKLEPLTIYQATELARNAYGRYECYFCPNLDFPYLAQLNQHLESPKHSKRSDTGMYTCPRCQHNS